MFDSDANRGRDPEPVDPNIRSMMRVALLGGFSILLALLWPRELFPVMLAGFLFINALMSAFSADPRTRSRRMRAMRRTIMEHDVARWAADFLSDLR